MDALSRCAIAALTAALLAAVVHADEPRYCGTNRWRVVIDEAAQRFDIPARWIRDVMRAESAGCAVSDGQPTTSSAGAMGLMQLMPQTWQMQRERLGLGDDPHDPRDNILAGAAYLRALHDRYGVPGAFAAYHAGPERYDAHLLHGQPLPPATLAYLERMQELARAAGEPPLPVHVEMPMADRLFAVVRHPVEAGAGTEPGAVDARLFVRLRQPRRIATDTSAAIEERADGPP